MQVVAEGVAAMIRLQPLKVEQVEQVAVATAQDLPVPAGLRAVLI
jgi:hypothetical protein